ncbi:hypothetical protein RhiJN_25835 [Ceratobasidium sp. AG-Ba]|nr:hypothetical protein RhiJN_25835 [Ceratobasidium sp. AG-Ba]
MVAAYIADWPEQNLIACTSEGSCPICVTKQKGRGDINNSQPLRDRNETLNAIRAYFDYKSRVQLKDLSLKPVWPWWASLPDTDFTTCLTPDLLHQLYQGVFKTHLVRWIQYLVGIKQLDSRFIATTQAAGMTHFGKGISRVEQWTGRESKEMLKQFLPLVVGDLSPELARLVTSAVEFIYQAHSSTMTDTDLQELDVALETFHRLKELMVKKGFYPSSARFDKIPKIHMLRHYSHSIRQLGTPDGYSTEAPEHLHIEYAKDPWRVSNKDEDGCEAEVEDECEPVELSTVTRAAGQSMEMTVSGVGVTRSTGGVVEDVAATANVSIEDARLEGQRGGTYPESASDGNTYYPDPVRRMAKYPTRPNLLVRDVIHDYGALDIKSAVADFLNKRFDIPGYNSTMSDSHRINLWHRLYLHHPAPPFAPLDPPQRDVVRASPTSLDDAGRPRKTGVWDVAMYLEKPNRRAFARSDPEKYGIHRYRAGRVRAFFTLPPGLSRYYPGHLAYLELFTPFNAGSSPTHGLHSTSWDRTSTGARRTLVVPVSEIVFACHLSPKFHLLDKELKLNAKMDMLCVTGGAGHQDHDFSIDCFPSPGPRWHSQLRCSPKSAKLLGYVKVRGCVDALTACLVTSVFTLGLVRVHCELHIEKSEARNPTLFLDLLAHDFPLAPVCCLTIEPLGQGFP